MLARKVSFVVMIILIIVFIACREEVTLKEDGYADNTAIDFRNNAPERVTFNEVMEDSLIFDFLETNDVFTDGSEGLYADTSLIYKIEVANSVRYIFGIEEDFISQTSGFKNLVIENLNNRIKGYIYTYEIDEIELYNYMFNGEIINSVNIIERDLDPSIISFRGCVTHQIQVAVPCTCVGDWPWESCVCSISSPPGINAYWNTQWVVICDGGGAVPFGPLETNGEYDSTDGGSGGTPPGTYDEEADQNAGNIPLFPPSLVAKMRAKHFKSTFSSEIPLEELMEIASEHDCGDVPAIGKDGTPKGGLDEGDIDDGWEDDGVNPQSDNNEIEDVDDYVDCMKTGVVAHVFGLEPDVMDAMDQEIKDRLFSLANNKIKICPEDSDPHEIIGDLIDDLWDSGDLNKESLDDELGNLELIEIVGETHVCGDLTMEKDCSKLKKILDLVVGPDGKNPNCDFLADLGKSKNTTQVIWDCNNSKINANSDGVIPLGQTRKDLEWGNVNVFFNAEVCNLDCVELLDVVLHEFLHAKLEVMALDPLPLPSPLTGVIVTTQDFRDTWFQIRDENFNGLLYKHEIMAQYYSEEYSKAMKDLTQVGDPKDYLYWAYKGLGKPPEHFVGAQAWEVMENDWNNIKNDVNLKCD